PEQNKWLIRDRTQSQISHSGFFHSSSSRCGLVDEAQPELELPHLRARSKSVYVPCVAAAVHASIRLSEVDVVDQVERLYSELQLLGFGNLEFLEQRRIGVEVVRPAQCVATHVSELSTGRFIPGRS